MHTLYIIHITEAYVRCASLIYHLYRSILC